MDSFIDSGIDFTVFFYNPNIHPRGEYEIRKNENIRYVFNSWDSGDLRIVVRHLLGAQATRGYIRP